VWDDFLLPYLVLDRTKYMTIPIVIQHLKGSYGQVDMGATMALILLSILPVIVFYRPQSDSLYKEATFFGLDFGKLEMAVNMQGRLIRTDAQTETDEEGFGRMMEAVVRKYGEPVGKTMETGKENLDKILKQALEELSVYHWDVGDDEYIELAAERRSDPAEDEEGEPVQEETASPCVEVTFSRTKKEFDLLFKEVFSPLAEDTEELLKDLKEAEQEIRQKWEESPKATSEKKE